MSRTGQTMVRYRALAALAAWSALLAVSCTASGCATLRKRVADRPPYRKVTPPIAYEILRDNANLLVLDLRPAQDFHGDTGHIWSAYNIPADRLPFRLLEISPFREETFLVYCDTRQCAEKGMAVLVSSGFENPILIEGGIEGWIARGFRTVLPAELIGKTQIQQTSAKSEPAPDGQGPAAVPAASAAMPANAVTSLAPQPAAETPVTRTPTGLTSICTEPHVAVQKPPR